MFDVRLGFLALLVSGGIIFAHPEAKKCPYVVKLEERLVELEKLPGKIEALEKEVASLKKQVLIASKVHTLPHRGKRGFRQ